MSLTAAFLTVYGLIAGITAVVWVLDKIAPPK